MKNLAEIIMVTWTTLFMIPLIVLVLLMALGISLVGICTHSFFIKMYGFNIAYSVDQFGNALLLGAPDETISSRTGRAIKSKKAKWFVYPLAYIVDTIFAWFGDYNHVLNNIEKDLNISKEIWNWIKD